MAGLLDAVAEAHDARRPYQTCTVRKILGALEDADARDLEAVLADAAYAATTIADVLAKRGVDVAPQTLNRHRKGRCGCARG